MGVGDGQLEGKNAVFLLVGGLNDFGKIEEGILNFFH